MAPRGKAVDAGRLRDAAGRLRHDLGKYARLSAPGQRETSTEDLRERLRADLLSTRSGPEETLTAVEVFDAWNAQDGGLFPAEGPMGEVLRRIAAAVTVLRELTPRLSALSRGDMERLDEATLSIARETRRLEREAAAAGEPSR